MTKKEAAERYAEMIPQVADVLLKVSDVKETCDFISSELHDAGDPDIIAREAIEKLGCLLACMISYKGQYENPEK